MLAHLLSGLARPYAYDPQRLYFDWQQRSWRLVPTYQANPDAAFADWLDRLVASKEIATLAGIAELARDALARVRAVKNQQQLYHEHRHVTRDGEQMQG
ncbi:MAG: hypothetical protein C5B50_07905 [Verrucomicrobia bacterium]|nr:MAG: hypothetical protein C5B50_07905 [Verrucomicrobiota bacterium]